MAKLVNAAGLGPAAERFRGSSPLSRTNNVTNEATKWVGTANEWFSGSCSVRRMVVSGRWTNHPLM